MSPADVPICLRSVGTFPSTLRGDSRALHNTVFMSEHPLSTRAPEAGLRGADGVSTEAAQSPHSRSHSPHSRPWWGRGRAASSMFTKTWGMESQRIES